MRLVLVPFLLAACGGMQTGQPLQSTQDVDHDEVPDVIDKCPYNPGPDVNSGCPMETKSGPGTGPDADNDGIVDRSDRCPNEPEDRDGFEDEDGCPEVDNDNDGVADVVDRCPSVPGPRTPDGCPTANPPTPAPPTPAPATSPTPAPATPAKPNPPAKPAAPNDRDADGILDANDNCPDLAEDIDRVDDTDGCPEPDNDSDGIPDVSDACPNLPESKNGKNDTDGCPD